MSDKFPVEILWESRGWKRMERTNRRRLDFVAGNVGTFCIERGPVRMEVAPNYDLVEREDGTVHFYDAAGNKRPVWTLCAIVTDPASRAGGFAGDALRDLFDFARSVGVARIQLSPCPIRGHKPPMKAPVLIAWYGRHGFKMLDGCKAVMEKSLTD